MADQFGADVRLGHLVLGAGFSQLSFYDCLEIRDWIDGGGSWTEVKVPGGNSGFDVGYRAVSAGEGGRELSGRPAGRCRIWMPAVPR